MGVGRYALVSECPEHPTIQRKLKSALKCTIWLQCTPVQDGRTNGQTERWTKTDGRTDIMAIARRSVLRTHRALKHRMFSLFASLCISPSGSMHLTLKYICINILQFR